MHKIGNKCLILKDIWKNYSNTNLYSFDSADLEIGGYSR